MQSNTTSSPPNPEDSAQPGVWVTLRELWQHRELLGAFVQTELKRKYVGSALGFMWSVMNPILELVTYTFVFNVLIGVRYHPAGGTTQYALFLFCGMVTWMAFADGLTAATRAITDQGHLIKKVRFPISVLPAQVVLSAVFNQGIRLAILAFGAIIFGEGLSAHFLLAPVFVLIQAIFTLGLAYVLATVSVYFRDTVHWISPALLLWMFITPIFYPPSVYPKRLELILQLNPMAHIVGVYQELILNHRLPHLNSMMVVCVCASLTVVVGCSVFNHHRKRFSDQV